MLKELTESEKRCKLLLAWPSPQDFSEALQYPSVCFNDPDLTETNAESDNFGLPKPRSGMFASVYKLDSSTKSYAVRCFLKWHPDQFNRYKEIEKSISQSRLSCMVGFEFQAEGIQIEQTKLPMLKMEWCRGLNLNEWVQHNLRKKRKLETFLEKWREVLNELNSNGIAHGDLQHGNILIDVDGEIKLVDYDGMYTQAFQGLESNEIGHRNYQHPLRNEKHFGPYLDNFSAWLIYLSVFIAGSDPHIWYDFEGGDECLLFRRQDLEKPLQSELFHVLEHHFNPQIREASRILRYLLSLKPEEVPGLAQALKVPDDLQELDGVLSDLPEWLSDSEAQELLGLDESETISKRIVLKRRRQKGVPLPQHMRIGSVSGRWIYDENGLIFNPEAKAPEQISPSISEPQNSEPQDSEPEETPQKKALHSPLLGTYTRPAPVCRIHGILSSPMLDDKSQEYDSKDHSNKLSDFKPLILPTIGSVVFIACLFLFQFIPGMIPQSFLPENYFNTNPPAQEEQPEITPEQEEANFRKELKELNWTKDSSDPLKRSYGLYNLACIENEKGNYQTAEDYLIRAEADLRKLKDHEYDLAGVLMELAKAYKYQDKLPEAELAYKRAIALSEKYGFVLTEEGMKENVESLISVLKSEGKTEEAANYENKLKPPAPVQNPQ